MKLQTFGMTLEEVDREGQRLIAEMRAEEIELALRWLLENDELTQAGRKVAEEALKK